MSDEIDLLLENLKSLMAEHDTPLSELPDGSDLDDLIQGLAVNLSNLAQSLIIGPSLIEDMTNLAMNYVRTAYLLGRARGHTEMRNDYDVARYQIERAVAMLEPEDKFQMANQAHSVHKQLKMYLKDE